MDIPQAQDRARTPSRAPAAEGSEMKSRDKVCCPARPGRARIRGGWPSLNCRDAAPLSCRHRPAPGAPLPQGTLLKDKLELVKIKCDGKTRYTIKPLEGELSFDKGFYVFIRAIQLLRSHNKDTVLVRGPSTRRPRRQPAPRRPGRPAYPPARLCARRSAWPAPLAPVRRPFQRR